LEISSIDYDTIIIGAGLAGLSSAYELKDKKVLMLEKNDYLGGRILTKKKNGVTYELGALLAYEPSQLPFKMESSRLIREEGGVGVSFKGSIIHGETVFAVIMDILERLENEDVGIVNAERKNVLEDIKNALFNVIHSGERKEYLDIRKQDAFITWPTDHFIGGNTELIDAFLKHISASIELGVAVSSVRDVGDRVIVVYRKGKINLRTHAKAVVIATPATVAKNILETSITESLDFLKTVRYGSGKVIVLCLSNVQLIDVRYVVTPYQKMNTIFKSRSEKPGFIVLTIYYSLKEKDELCKLSDKDLCLLTLKEINQTGIGKILEKNIVFFDVHSWAVLSTIIDESYLKWSQECGRPTQRIFLTGDYMQWKEDQIPYGINAAINNGLDTGRIAKAMLDAEDFQCIKSI